MLVFELRFPHYLYIEKTGLGFGLRRRISGITPTEIYNSITVQCVYYDQFLWGLPEEMADVNESVVWKMTPPIFL